MSLRRQQQIARLQVPVDDGGRAVVEEAEGASELEPPPMHHVRGGAPRRALVHPPLLKRVLQASAVKEFGDDDLGFAVEAGAEEEHEVGVPQVRQHADLVLKVQVVGLAVAVLEDLADDGHATPVGAQHIPLLPLPEQLPHLDLVPFDEPLLGLGAEGEGFGGVRLHLQLRRHALHLLVLSRPRVQQHLLDLGVPPSDGVLERIAPPPVLAMDVSTTLNQELDDLVVPLRARQMQRRPAVVVGGVDAGAHRDQELDVRQVPLGGSIAHAIAVILVVRVVVLLATAAGLTQDGLHLRVAPPDRVLERVAPPPVLAVDVGAVDHEERHHLIVPLRCRQVQRRPPVIVTGVDGGPLGDKALDLL
mmetsp:Transcript_11380/g.22899  ORF Transcript_11380/g.22899 Transcript_11380/m.22899 type:complete len:361 (-) Transcript_11380:1062-2144(-)